LTRRLRFLCSLPVATNRTLDSWIWKHPIWEYCSF